MRLDNAVGYAMTGLFVVLIMTVGAELLYTTGVALGDTLRGRFGRGVWILFMVGFWATSMTSVLGVWNGGSLIFSDFVRDLRGRPAAESEAATRTPEFCLYMLWLRRQFVPLERVERTTRRTPLAYGTAFPCIT